MLTENTFFDSVHGYHRMGNTEITLNYIFCKQRRKSFIQSAKTRPDVNCASDDKLLPAKSQFNLKLKKRKNITLRKKKI